MSDAVVSTDFATNLEQHLQDNLVCRPLQRRRLLRILQSPPSDQRTRRLALMENHVRTHLGLAGGPIDWSKVDWNSILSTIIQLLLAILPLILKTP